MVHAIVVLPQSASRNRETCFLRGDDQDAAVLGDQTALAALFRGEGVPENTAAGLPTCLPRDGG